MKVFNEPHGSIKEIIGYGESHKEICFILYSWFQKLNSGSCSHLQENGSQGLNMDCSVIYTVSLTYRMYDLVKNVIQIFQLVTIQSIWRYQAVGLIGKKGAKNCGCEIWFNPSRICLIWPLYFPQQGNQIRQIEEITFPNLQTPFQ